MIKLIQALNIVRLKRTQCPHLLQPRFSSQPYHQGKTRRRSKRMSEKKSEIRRRGEGEANAKESAVRWV